ncbi:hypothetical protein ACTFIR_011950 [Dictyostelium discoideum]
MNYPHNTDNNDIILLLIDCISYKDIAKQSIDRVKQFVENENDFKKLVNNLNIGLDYISQPQPTATTITITNNGDFKSQLYSIMSDIFQTVYIKNKDIIEFNNFISIYYTPSLLTSLLTPIINHNIISFLQIFKIILNCKIKHLNVFTVENINDIQYFYRSLKNIVTRYPKIINRNSNILKLISSLIIEINENSIKYLIKNEELLTKPISMLLVKIIIDDLSTLPITMDQKQYDETIYQYTKTIQLFWNSNQLSSIQVSMEHMFKKLMMSSSSSSSNTSSSSSSNENEIITPSISNVLNQSPIELIPLFINIIDNGSVSDIDLLETITKLTQWPLTPTNSKWILETFNSLIRSKKTTLLASIVVESALSVIKQMFVLPLLSSSFEILQKMLLGYQHSPDTFHSIIDLFPIVIELLLMFHNKINAIGLVNDGNGDDEHAIKRIEFINQNTQQTVYKLINECNKNRKELLLISIKNTSQPSKYRNTILITLIKFCQLSYTLMFHHTGYPELYAPLLESLNRCNHLLPSIPSEFQMKRLLQDNEWQSLDSMVFENIKLNRVLTDRSGLINLGNTCYMNSFLQSLYMTIPFRNYLLFKIDQNLIKFINNNNTNNNDEEIFKIYSKEILKRPQLLKQIQLLFGNLRLSIKESISPNLFLQSLPIEFQTGQQHDSFEFGKSLLDHLDLIFKQQIKNEQQQLKLNNSNNDSNSKNIVTEISNQFGGKLSQITTCRKCNSESIKVEEFLELSLPFHDHRKQQYQLEEMINGYLSNEELIGDNRYHCSKCNSLQDADKIIEINETPNHLIIGLNRFHFSRETKSIEKLLNHVDYPLNLNLPFIQILQNHQNHQNNDDDDDDDEIKNENEIENKNEKEDFKKIKINENENDDGDDGDENSKEKKKKSIIKLSNYSLYSVIIHSGRSPTHGHYYNYSCTSSNNSNGKPMDWCLFNDSMVKITDVQTFKNINKQFYTDVPYILFYVKNPSLPSPSSPIDNTIDNTNNDDNVSPWIKQSIIKENQNLLSKFNNTKNKNSNILEQFHTSAYFKKK